MNDVLFVIFINLSINDLLNIKLTCKQFNLIVNDQIWIAKYHIDKLPFFNKILNFDEYKYVKRIVDLSKQMVKQCPSSIFDSSLLNNVRHIDLLPERFRKFVVKYTNLYIITSVNLSWCYNNNLYKVLCSVRSGNRYYKMLSFDQYQILPFLHHLFYYEFRHDYRIG
jgi:hypothetical protein